MGQHGLGIGGCQLMFKAFVLTVWRVTLRGGFGAFTDIDDDGVQEKRE